MEPSNWPSEHSDALRECFVLRLSYLEAAAAINRKFNTSYSRNAVLSRATRMGLMGSRLPELPPGTSPAAVPGLSPLGETRPSEPGWRRLHWPPAFEKAETPKLRCVETEPRHLSLIELERADCRYPYGGDGEGEAITFCGQPRRPGSSYCTPHFHLSRCPVTPSERTGQAILLRVTGTA
jgi:GcrA cell cycle regulator